LRRSSVLDPKKTTVAEIMSRDVLTLQAAATLQEAVASLRDAGVSGAPVLDEGGECIGVFSLADLARREDEVEDGEAPHAGSYFNFGLGEKLALPAEDYDPELFDRETVGDWMSPEIKSVAPGTSLADAARKMVEDGVHRLVVMDEKSIAGILTTFDFVRLFVAPGEKRAPRRGAAKKGRSSRAAR
jgi:CBS domain-containing protein